MKAIITDGKGQIELVDVPMPECGDYDCLVKIESCLFCNSTDRHIVENSFNFGLKYPAILGHESVGIVEKAGAKVTNFNPGDRVLRAYAAYPDEMFETYGLGWGGFAEYGKIKDYKAMINDNLLSTDEVPSFYLYMQKVPDSISWEESLMMSCQKEILSSVNKFDKIKNRRFLIAGAGVTACLYADFLKMQGAAHVCVTARRAEPLQFIKTNTTADTTVILDDIQTLNQDFDALVDTTGNLALASRLMDTVVVPNGIFYSYAVYPGMEDSEFFAQVIEKYNFKRVDPVEAEAHAAVCQLIEDKKLNATPYITFSFKPKQVVAAWDTIKQKKTMKTAIVFSA